jgi:hypothetical protein
MCYPELGRGFFCVSFSYKHIFIVKQKL